MRITSAVQLIIASFLIIPGVGFSSSAPSLSDSPIEFRLRHLGYLLSQLDASKPAEQDLWGSGTRFQFVWNAPADAFNPVAEDRPATKIVETAISFLKELPKELRPETSNLLGVAKYQISRSKTMPKWIWVAEFRVDDQSPMAGLGYAQTLFVPVSRKGTVLLDVQRR